MRLRSFLLLSCLVVSGGCVSTASSSRTAPERPPEADADVAAPSRASCDAIDETYGRSPETPLEWGSRASALGTGFMSRIACASGARVQIHRVGNVGSSPVASSSPRCGVLSAVGGSDVIDRWEVACPGEPVQTWYMNAYRCGSDCLPAGFSLVPEEMSQALTSVERALERQDHSTAEQSARRALALSPDDEEANKWMGTVLFVAGRPVEARPYFEAALRAHPGHPYHRLHIAMTLQDEDYAGYANIVGELRAELADDHALHWELVCRHAHALRRDVSRRAEASDAAAQACAAEFDACCGFDPTPPS